MDHKLKRNSKIVFALMFICFALAIMGWLFMFGCPAKQYFIGATDKARINHILQNAQYEIVKKRGGYGIGQATTKRAVYIIKISKDQLPSLKVKTQLEWVALTADDVKYLHSETNLPYRDSGQWLLRRAALRYIEKMLSVRLDQPMEMIINKYDAQLDPARQVYWEDIIFMKKNNDCALLYIYPSYIPKYLMRN